MVKRIDYALDRESRYKNVKISEKHLFNYRICGEDIREDAYLLFTPPSKIFIFSGGYWRKSWSFGHFPLEISSSAAGFWKIFN